MAVTSFIDTRALTRTASAFRKAQPVLAREVRGSMRLGGEIVAHDAAFLLMGISTQIPPTIKVEVRKLLNVAVVAGDIEVGAITGLLEVGQKGGSSGTFRHPVFGHDVWVSQDMHPFLTPAAMANLDRIEALADAAIEKVALFAATYDEV